MFFIGNILITKRYILSNIYMYSGLVYFVHIHSPDEVHKEEMAQRARIEYSVCVNSRIEKLKNEKEGVYSFYLSAQ